MHYVVDMELPEPLPTITIWHMPHRDPGNVTLDLISGVCASFSLTPDASQKSIIYTIVRQVACLFLFF